MKMIELVKLARLSQWIKNLMLFFPPFLGGVFVWPGSLTRGALPFAAFCCASSSVYIFNDIIDFQHDREHPDKRNRPIPSGAVSIPSAMWLSGSFLIGAVLTGFLVSVPFLYLVVAYLSVSAWYTLRLKHLPLFDIFCISSGFVFRLLAGGEAFGIVISDWLFLSVFLLSLFLSTGKRLCEKNRLGAEAGQHRKALLLYPAGFLEGAMYLTGGVVLVTYTMYVISRHTLIYTVPLCCFGLLRYILRVQSGNGGDPTESLLKDPLLFMIGLVWVVMVAGAIYG